MLNNVIVRLFVYYVVVMAFLFGLLHVFPQVHGYVVEERNRVIAGLPRGGEATSAMPQFDPDEGVSGELSAARTVPILMALCLAFVVTLPVTWVYRWTRRPTKRDQAFVHTLLVIPIAIALVVFLVKGSLALAFSLAGIVAAVRFRTTLKQPMDGVYMLMAIGIGLAAGTQLIVVAFIASVIFTAIALGVWKSNYGADPATVSGWTLVRSVPPASKAKELTGSPR